MKRRTSEQKTIIDQLTFVARGISETFAPFCEVVVHDLLDPKHAVLAIHNNLSGRTIGDPATDLGMARIEDPQFAQVLANYANRFADGRQAKSTSVGIKDSTGNYIAALCMNIDLTLFNGLKSAMGQFVGTDPDSAVTESLDPAGADLIRRRIDEFAARLATTPRSLKAEDRRALLAELKESGCMEVRRSMETVALHLGVSRAAAYGYAK